MELLSFLSPFILAIFAAFPLALAAMIRTGKNRREIQRLQQENQALRARMDRLASQRAKPQSAAPLPTAASVTAAPQPAVRPSVPAAAPSVPTVTAPVTVSQKPPAPVTPPPGSPAPQKSSPVTAAPAAPEKKKNLENVFGKNILALAATGLIFVGMIAFGVLAFSKITDEVKILGMFLASFAITAVGVFLSRKGRNAFTEILSGCGVGAVYISILITHLYFERIGDLVAFGLILLWGAGLFLLSRWIKSKAMVYIAHFGCILSTVLSVAYGQTTGKYIEITLYQLVTFSLLILANRKEKVLHTVSSFASMIINTVLCAQLVNALDAEPYALDTFWILGVLLLALNVFNGGIYLLSLRRPSFESKGHSILTNAIFFTVFFFGGFVCGQTYFEDLSAYLFPDSGNAVPCGLTLLMILLTLIPIGTILAVFQKKDHKIHGFLAGQIFLSVVLFILAILLDADGGALPLTSLFAAISGAACLFLRKKGDEKTARLMGNYGLTFLLIDLVLSLFFLWEFEIFGIFYSLILIALSFFFVKLKGKSVWSFPFFPLAVLLIHFTVTASSLFDHLTGETYPALILTTGGAIVLSVLSQWAIPFPTSSQSISRIFCEIGEAFWILIASILLSERQDLAAATGEQFHTVCLMALWVFLLFLGLLRIPAVVSKKNGGEVVWYAIKFTYLALFPIGQFTNLFDEPFLFSVFLMVAAALCIIFGFIKNLKSARIYGLALTLASVLKMVIVDVWDQNSLTRVASLIAGGMICFAISAGYSAMEKRQTKKESETKNTLA